MLRNILITLILIFPPIEVFSQEDGGISLIKGFYQSDVDFSRDFDYAKYNQKHSLEMLSGETQTLGWCAMMAGMVGNSILANKYDWNLWVDIPIATIVSIAAIVPFILISGMLEQSAGRISVVGNPNTVMGLPKDDALKKMRETLDSCRHYGLNDVRYAECLLWSSRVYAEFGDGVTAEQLIERSSEIYRQNVDGTFDGRDTVAEIYRLDVQSLIDDNDGLEFEALQNAKKSCDLKAQVFGDTSSVYLSALLDLSRRYAGRLRYHKSQICHTKGYYSYIELIKREFCSSSESERSLYWNTARRYIGKTIDLAYNASSRWRTKRNSELATSTYDALLLSKGLLLNTTIGFERYVTNSGSDKAIRNLKIKKDFLSQGAEQHVLDSMDYAILAILEAEGLAYNIPHLSITWRDVQARLGTDDLAVEFFRNTAGEYGAVLIKKNWKNPRLVRLKNYLLSNDKSAVTLDDALRNPGVADAWAVGRSVWNDNIIKYFPQTSEGCVFFSADGEMQVAGIEYLPLLEVDSVYYCISDYYNIHRLSSTRVLAIGDTSVATNSAVIYGGLHYNYSEDGQENQAFSPSVRPVEPEVSDSQHVRGAVGLSYLEGSKIEADSIVDIINHSEKNSISVSLYTGAYGTETSFKNLNGKRNRIIHVATHGFFVDENDSILRNQLAFGDNPLSWSGLIMSGAEESWFGFAEPDAQDDGLLTALEISSLDLQGVDLMVLSACESAKGNISADGVFGLQRGFKMAGVKSILMSLWKVDDEATCLLMTEFYKNWIAKGKTKHDALELAKQTVRSHKEKGWDDPKYWAAFILLDALD